MDQADDGPGNRELARRFLSLWQRQIQVAATDDSLAGLFGQWLQQQGGGETNERGRDGLPEDIAASTGAASGDGNGGPDRRGRGGTTGG